MLLANILAVVLKARGLRPWPIYGFQFLHNEKEFCLLFWVFVFLCFVLGFCSYAVAASASSGSSQAEVAAS